jgi:hypothetical protein
MATTTDTTSSTDPGVLPSGEWYVDPGRSQVHFHTRAMFGLFPVLGRFERFGGALRVTEAGGASGELRLDAESVRTGIGKRDAHLRTPDFFYADAHPHVTFDLAEMTPDGDSHQVSGTLRIRARPSRSKRLPPSPRMAPSCRSKPASRSTTTPPGSAGRSPGWSGRSSTPTSS